MDPNWQGPKMDDRTFNKLNYTYAQSGLSLIIDPTTRVQQLAFHEDSVVIDIGRSATGDKKYINMRVAYSIYFGPDSAYNQAKRLNPDIEQNVIAADLVATLCILQTLPTMPNFREIKTVVIKSSETPRNSGFHDHITNTIWVWAENDYLNSKRKPVGFGDLFRQAHELILELKDRGVEVKFWMVHKKHNKVAETMANKALSLRD